MLYRIDSCQCVAGFGSEIRIMSVHHVADHPSLLEPDHPGQEESSSCTANFANVSLTREEAEVLSSRFKALSDPNRLRIMSIISSNADSETCVCDLSEPLNLSQPTVSHHLKVLVEAGMLRREKRGIWAYYSLVPGSMKSLFESLE